MPETKALVPLKDLQIEKIFESEKTCDEILAQIEDYAFKTTFDITTAKGRAACVSHAADVSRSANAVDKKGLEMTKGMRDKIAEINQIRKKVKEKLKPMAKEVRSPVTVWEKEEQKKKDAEEARIKAIHERIEAISLYNPRNERMVPIPLETATADQISAAIKDLNKTELKESFYEEFLDKASDAKKKRLIELSEIEIFRREQEKLEVEKEELRKKEKAIEDEKKRLEQEAEKQRKETEEREANRKEAEKRKKEAEEEAERKIRAEKEKELRLKEKRIADIEHRRAVNREVIALFIAVGFSEEEAIKIVKTIVKAKNEHITINY